MQLTRIVDESIETIASLKNLNTEFENASKLLVETYRKGGKVLLCGNGGSAADAQHIETELVHRFEKDRKCLPAIALTINTSTLTAIGNDWNFDQVFEKFKYKLLKVNSNYLCRYSFN